MLRKTTSTTSIALSLLLFIDLLLFGVSLSFGADSPHNSVNAVSCISCHNDQKAAENPDWWTQQDQHVCGTCHNSATEFYAVTHETSAGIIAQCTVCHDPHRQQQSRQWKASSYLYSNTSDLVSGITRTALKKTGVGWAVNQWKDMLLLPNVLTPLYIYRIVSNTSDTLFIDTRGEAPDNQINTSSAKSGNTFGIVRGNYVKPAINGKYVRFFRETGTNSFADDTPTIDGVCQVCHTSTSSFTKTGVLEGSGHPALQAGKKCTSCHGHKSGFKAACKDCHGTPPLVNTRGGPDGLLDENGGTGSTSAGAHTKHAVTIGYSCDACHAGGMPGSSSSNTEIEIGFNIGSYQSGTYDGRSSLVNGYSYTAGNAGTVITNNNSQTCSTYCHGIGNTAVTPSQLPADPAYNGTIYAAPTWTGSPLSCNSCHGRSTLNGIPDYSSGGQGSTTANSHPEHVVNNSYGCQKCHAQTTTDGLTISSNRHVNADTQDVFFDSGNPTGSYNRSAKTCSSTYCHGPGAPVWGDASFACDDCHNANNLLQGRHGKHYGTSSAATSRTAANNSSTVAYIYNCGVCHDPSGTTHAAGTVGADQAAQVSFNATIAGSGIYTPGSAVAGTDKGFNWTAGSCNSLYCHSNAAPAPNDDPAKNEANLYRTIAWNGGALQCFSCHNGRLSDNTPANCSSAGGSWDIYCTGSLITQSVCEANGGSWNSSQNVCRSIAENNCNAAGGRIVSLCTSTLTMSSNGHERLAGPQWIRKYPCTYCHNATVDANGTIIDVAKHVNRTRDVVMATQWSIVGRPTPSYDPATGCSNVYCHSDGTTDPDQVRSFRWTQGKTECNTCHGHPQGTCANANCHDGRTDGSGKYWPVKTGWAPGEEWKAAMPMFENKGPGTARANSHPRHLLTDFACDACHLATIKNGVCTDCHAGGMPSGNMNEVAHIDPAYHVNKTKDVVFKDGGSYNLTDKTCSNTSCHTGGTDPVWGGSVNSMIICVNCHGTSAQDVDDFGSFNATQAKINLTQWTTNGHGRPSSAGNYPSGNPPANFPGNPCWYCHDNNVLHKDAANPFRLRKHNQFTKRFDKECVYCHMEGTDSECLGCHNAVESMAPQLIAITQPPFSQDHTGYADGMTSCTTICHSTDETRHKTAAGTWSAAQKADIKNQYEMMGVCLQCHDDDREGQCTSCHTGSQYRIGYDPGTGFIKPQKARASSVHFGYKHFQDYLDGLGWKGGKFCWDCHDPHGDNNIFMVQDKVATSTDGIFGKPLTRADVVFTKKQSGLDYAKNSAPYNGICNVCHTSGGQHYRADYGDGHNAGRICTSCHEHRFTDSHSSGSPCNTCHLSKPVPRHSAFGLPRDCTKCHSGVIEKRMDIMGQLKSNSHHIQGVTITNKHCYACHWEATELGLINTDHHEGYNYQTHSSEKNAAVDLVVWGPGARPASYQTGTTAISFLATGIGTANERTEVNKVTTHCLGCHSDQNNDTQPFDDCKTPRQYAWDRMSIASRYTNTTTTVWGKYAAYPNAAKKNLTKAFSAHGNAQDNFGGGWDTALNGTGIDGNLNPTRGGANAKSVQCFDCHNSHGSKVIGTTSSYVTFNGTQNGGNLKETQAGKGGYNVSYKAAANTAGINPYNAGAGQCFDCHETVNAYDSATNPAGTTPWGYLSTFGAVAPVMGYMDTPRFGAGVNGMTGRTPFKKAIVDDDMNMGGHFKRSSTPLDHSPEGSINGLCTPCHDPHGVSRSLNNEMAYAVPLLKGTWLTSPYKEDRPLDGPTTGTRGSSSLKPYPSGDAVYPYVNTDQRTFGSGNWLSEDDALFAGLCLRCHPKASLTDDIDNNGAWKSRDRIHESVKGWGDNQMHAYSCSKCHQSHVTSLPRLMQTNCLNFTHRGRVSSGGAVGSGSGSEGSGSFPKGFGNYLSNCHPTGTWPDNLWNSRTPW